MLRWTLVAGLVVGLSGDDDSAAKRLPKRQQAQLAAIVEAAEYAGPVEIVEAAAAIAARLSDSHLAAMNEALAEQGLPSVGELLVFSRIRLEDANQSKAVRRPKFRERMRMLTAIADFGDEALKPARKTLADDLKLPEESMKAFEERLRLISARHRSVQSALRTAEFGRSLAAKIPPRSRQRLKGDDAAAVDRNSPERIEELQQTAGELFELQLALRLKRLDYGVRVLEQTKGKLTKERFLAAQSTGLDGRYLQGVVSEAKKSTKPDNGAGPSEQPAEPTEPLKPPFKRAELNDLQLENSIAERMKKAEELSGDLAVKARHFFEGLDWWVRGRFGSGPDLGGLVKSAESLKSPERLYYVQMPIELPTPLAPTNLTRLRPNHIDRRHHYIWNWEDRKFIKTNRWSETRRLFRIPKDVWHMKGLGYDGPMVVGTWGKHETRQEFRSVHLSPQDPRLVYRLVGFVEYTKALEHLDQFVKGASLRELELADEIVRDNDQFIVHTNLSRQLEKQPNVLSERGRNERDDFARHGLKWVMGLARIELGAMLAGFATAKEPFRLMVPPQKSPRAPERYGAEEYYELLVDGMRTHYWSLKRDPEIWNYRKTGVPEHHLVTHTRRVTVALQFFGAARNASTGLMNRPQFNVIGQWEQEIAAVHRMLVYCLAKKQGQERFAMEQFDKGNLKSRTRLEPRRQVSRSSLPEKLELIDPTLKFCQCR